MRRKHQGGYTRGEETRARILGVAVELFGNLGFDSVTTRDVATAAAVPPNSLRYYFGNKQGLYIACLDHVNDRLFALLEPTLSMAEALVDDENATIDQLIENYCTLQDARVESMMGGSDGSAAALFTIRHDLPSQSGAGTLSGAGAAVRRISICYLRMMVRISGNSLDMQSALLVTGLINGELMNICLRRNRLSQIGWEATSENLEWLKRTVRKHTRAILESYRA